MLDYQCLSCPLNFTSYSANISQTNLVQQDCLLVTILGTGHCLQARSIRSTAHAPRPETWDMRPRNVPECQVTVLQNRKQNGVLILQNLIDEWIIYWQSISKAKQMLHLISLKLADVIGQISATHARPIQVYFVCDSDIELWHWLADYCIA